MSKARFMLITIIVISMKRAILESVLRVAKIVKRKSVTPYDLNEDQKD